MKKNDVVADAEIVLESETEVLKPLDNLTNRVASALTIDKNSFFETIPSENGEALEVSKKTYSLVNPVGKRATVTVYDLSLIEEIEKIGRALYGKTILTYSICKGFSNMAKGDKLERLGFKTIAEFGKAFYGLETSTVNHYTTIGTNFINDDFTIKNGLPDLSISHFIELSSLVENGNITPIVKLYADGTLTDGMSTKKVRETLKALKTPLLTDSAPAEVKLAETTPTENVATVVPSSEEMASIEADFSVQTVVAKILNATTVIDELFDMLRSHGTLVVGYGESIDAIKAIAKSLL